MPLMFPTILRPASFNSNQEFALTIGATSTMVFCQSNANRTFFGLAATGGNIDGMVVCFVNITNTSGFGHSFAHESSSASSPLNRFWCPSQATLTTGSGIGAVTFRYDGTIQRWIVVSRTG